MGYKILDVKAEIHEDVEKYFRKFHAHQNGEGFSYVKTKQMEEELLDIVDEHFEKIER